MSARSIVLTVTASLCALALFVLVPSAPSDLPLDEREAYEKMLAEHPFNQRARMTSEELKAIPKKDRPDLAIEQDFLRTMDPSTGTIPVERLLQANRIATDSKRRGGGPLVTSDWVERGPTNVGGRTRAIMFDPNDENQTKLWAGGVAGGLWVTGDVTSSSPEWTAVNDFWSNLAISAIAYDPTDTQVFYAGTGEGWFNADAVRGGGIFKSENGGETWDLLESTSSSTYYNIQDLLVDGLGDVYASTREGGLRRSQDGGETWEVVLGAGGNGAVSDRAADLEMGPDGRLYVTFGIFSQGAVYASDTGDAASWERISSNDGFATSFQRVELAVAPSDANVLYAVTQAPNNSVQGVYRSNDAGASWTETSFPGHPGDAFRPPGAEPSNRQAWYDLIIEIDPNDAEVVYLGTIDFQRSQDGGATWNLISSAYGSPGVPYMHPDQHNMLFRNDSSDELIFANDGGIYYVADASTTPIDFEQRNSGYNVTQFYSAALNPDAGSNTMLGGTQDNGTHRFQFEGAGQTSEAQGGDGGFTFIDQDLSVVAIASTVFNNFRRSGNGGISFSLSLLSDGSTGSFINPADYDDDEDILYTYRTSTTLYRVSNVSSSPSVSTISGSFNSAVTHIRVSPYAPEGTSTVFVGTAAGRIFKITDAQGQAMVTPLLSIPTPGAISCIEIGSSENQLLVTSSNYGVVSVVESVNGGRTWSNKEGDLPDMPVRWALYNPSERDAVVIATEAGVWETTSLGDSQPTWTPAPGFPTVRTDMLQYRPSDERVMAATHGRGVFTSTFEKLVSTEDGATVANTHTLQAAYPNPFVSQATVGLSIAQAQEVRVEVFNTVGQRVALLHDGALAAGAPHRFTLDGQNLASGTYVYVVTGERFRDEGRVTLVR